VFAGTEISLEESPALDTLKRLWLDLQAHSEHSFFQSWYWVGCWLQILPKDIPSKLLVARFEKEIVGLAVLVEHNDRRRFGLIRSRTLYLHQTGCPDLDRLSIDHNGFLAHRRHAGLVRDACLNFFAEGLRTGRWDEVVLAQVPPSYATAANGLAAKIRQLRSVCHFIDLTMVRERHDEYLQWLSKRARRQIRRTIRKYSEHGPIVVEEAHTLRDAKSFFEEMVALHQVTWAGRGIDSDFADGFNLDFHRLLVKSHFDSHAIQLARVSAGSKILGYSYYLVDYEGSRKYSLGLMIEYLLITHNCRQGAKYVDFLFGDSTHKRRLGNATVERVRLVMQGDHLKFRIENRLRELKQSIRRLRALCL
jgi:CelD/BcsL family acetyltransferase involved in cellulose biosynthesis